MTTNLQTLLARLRLDAAEFIRGLGQARGQAQGFGAQLKGVLMPVAAALTAAFSAQALFGGVMQGAREIDQVAKSARAVGGSIGGFRALELAAGESGAAVETLREQVQNMDRQIAAGRAEPALRALGLEAGKLAQLDVDERMATIADRVRDLGLSTGESMAILQAFGVENRNVALLMMQGGDAIRAASRDVQDYGLALSQVDAARVEQANDRIGRLQLVMQYLRQEMAAGILPAMGELARVITDSLREGGALRAWIDGVTERMRGFAEAVSSVITIVVSMAEWVRQLNSEGGALSTALSGLSSVVSGLLSPFTSVLDIMASIANWFADLIGGAGSFGAALGALGSVAVEVWDRIKLGAEGMGRAMSSVASLVSGAFMRAFGAVLRKFAEVTQTIAEGINGMFAKVGISTNLSGMDAGGGAEIEAAGEEEMRVGTRQGEAASAFFNAAKAPLQSVQVLKDIVAGYRENQAAADSATESALRFNSALDGLAGGGAGGGGGGGGSAQRAKTGVDAATESLRQMQAALGQIKSSVGNAFVGLITGAKSLRQALGELLMDFAKLLANRAFEMLWRGGGGGGLSSIFGGLLGLGGGGGGKWWLGGRSFDGGGHTGFGARTGGLDGKGGFLAMLHPNETVLDHTRGQTGAVTLTVYSDPSVIVRTAQATAVQVVQARVPGMIGAGMAKARERGAV